MILNLVERCKKVVIPALMVIGIPAAITGCSSDGTKVLPVIDTNDHLTESNELQDQLLKMGLMEEYGEVLGFGATVGARGVRDDDWKHMLRTEGYGKVPVWKGAPRQGVDQGHSQLSTKIVSEAKRLPQLTVTIGGKWTDTALAVKHNPEICGKLRVIGIGDSNIGGIGRTEYETVRRCVQNLTVIDRAGYAPLIQEHCSTSWLNTYVKPKLIGGHVYQSHGVNWVGEAAALNRGQFGVNSICRIADFKATAWGMNGKMTDGKLMQDVTSGVKKLP